MKQQLIREIIIEPAYDKRNSDPSKDYGINGCEIRFLLKGKKGAVQFLIYTNWCLPHVTEEMLKKPIRDEADIRCRFLPMAADLGYHSPKPLYKDQFARKNCPYLGGKTCYYDGSGLNAEPVFERMLKEGSGGVWKDLEDYYIEIFGDDNV